MEAFVLCLVVAISDGDTLKVRCQDAPMQVIRLCRGRRHAGLQLRRTGVTASTFDTRHRAPVAVPGLRPHLDRLLVAQLRQVLPAALAEGLTLLGWAWAFPKYLKDKSLPAVEATARADRRGLWADQAPTPPWEWQAQRKAAPAQAGRI